MKVLVLCVSLGLTWYRSFAVAMWPSDDQIPIQPQPNYNTPLENMLRRRLAKTKTSSPLGSEPSVPTEGSEWESSNNRQWLWTLQTAIQQASSLAQNFEVHYAFFLKHKKLSDDGACFWYLPLYEGADKLDGRKHPVDTVEVLASKPGVFHFRSESDPNAIWELVCPTYAELLAKPFMSKGLEWFISYSLQLDQVLLTTGFGKYVISSYVSVFETVIKLSTPKGIMKEERMIVTPVAQPMSNDGGQLELRAELTMSQRIAAGDPFSDLGYTAYFRCKPCAASPQIYASVATARNILARLTYASVRVWPVAPRKTPYAQLSKVPNALTGLAIAFRAWLAKPLNRIQIDSPVDIESIQGTTVVHVEPSGPRKGTFYFYNAQTKKSFTAHFTAWRELPKNVLRFRGTYFRHPVACRRVTEFDKKWYRTKASQARFENNGFYIADTAVSIVKPKEFRRRSTAKTIKA